MKTILLPIDGVVPHWNALRWVETFRDLVAPSARVHLLHVGFTGPAMVFLDTFRGSVTQPEMTMDVKQGPVVETILEVAEEIRADIIAMPTAGHEGVLDALRGSVTERVLHKAPCPILAIPAKDRAGAR